MESLWRISVPLQIWSIENSCWTAMLLPQESWVIGFGFYRNNGLKWCSTCRIWMCIWIVLSNQTSLILVDFCHSENIVDEVCGLLRIAPREDGKVHSSYENSMKIDTYLFLLYYEYYTWSGTIIQKLFYFGIKDLAFTVKNRYIWNCFCSY